MINWQSVAFVRLLIPFALGIVANETMGWYLPTSFTMVFCSAFFLVVVVLAFFKHHNNYRGLFGVVITVFFFALGWVLCWEYNELRAPNHFSTLPHKYLTGTIVDAPVVANRVKCQMKVYGCGAVADSILSASGNILLYLDTTPTYKVLRYGDKIVWECRITETPPVRNPNAMDFKKYLHYQNVHYQGFVKGEKLLVSAHDEGNRVWSSAYQLRDYFLVVLRKYISEERENGVANALLLGYKENLDEDLEQAYMETGSIHILAVSGGHVGILFAGLMLVFSRVMIFKKWWRYVETIIILVIIWGFALITGFGASIARAALMFTLFLVGRAFYRDQNPYNTLAASAFFLLLYNPYMLFQVGFQLSYTAVLGMVVFLPYFKKISMRLPSPMVPLADMIFLGVAAQLGTLPLALYYFHQFPMYFWLSGIVVVPMATVFMYLVMVILMLDGVGWSFIASTLGWACEKMLWLANECILLIQQLPGSLINGLYLNIADVWLLYLALGCLVYLLLERKGKYLVYSMIFLLVFGMQRAFNTWKAVGQEKIVLYHNSKHLIMDIYYGFEGVRLARNAKRKDVQFVAAGNQIAQNVLEVELLNLDSLHNKEFLNKTVFVCPPLICFKERKFLLVQPNIELLQIDSTMLLDAIILSGNPKLRLQDCLQRYKPKVVVADATNPPWKIDTWRSVCKEYKIPFYDVKQQGAWVSN